MKFYNLCTEALYTEAKKVIDSKAWHPLYKNQLLDRVQDVLEAGNWTNTKTGGLSVAFAVGDVEELVAVISGRDDA